MEILLRYVNVVWESLSKTKVEPSYVFKIELSLSKEEQKFVGILNCKRKIELVTPVSHKKRPAFDRILLPEDVSNDILQYLIK